MADKKKPIKQCRIKADTCFKWHCMGKLFGLNLEDIGLMYMISQIQDDEGNIRHSLIEEEILDIFKETEAEWLALHSAKMKTDPLYRIAFADLNGQRKATTNHYKAEVERRKAYNERIKKENGEDTETGNITENVITSNETNIYTDCFTFGTKNIVVKYTTDTIKNIPEKDDIEDLKINCDDDLLIKMLEIGNAEEWKRHYEEILNELQTEQQIETETPFDCLESESE